MSEAARTATDAPSEHDDGTGVWHWAVIVLAVTTSGLGLWNLIDALADGALTAATGWRAAVSIAAPLLVVAVWLWAKPRIESPGVFLTLMLVATAAILGLAWSHPGFAGALSFLMPLTWLAAPGPRPAIFWTVMIMASAAVGMILGGETNPWFVVFVAIFSIALSCAIGLSIQKLHAQVQIRQQLLEELHQKQDEVTVLSSESAAARERASVLRDVHDAVTQNLTAIVMHARLPEPDAALIQDLAEEALEETRALLLKATPRHLEQGIATAITRLAERFERETGILVHAALEEAHLSLESEIVLLRATQEAFANVRKHAGASNVTITLCTEAEDAVLKITDDGSGFDTSEIPPDRGLAGVRDRVREAGGSGAIDASDGTKVTVRLPRSVA